MTVEGDLAAGGHAIEFGPFRLLPKQQLLVEGDTQVRLGSRALDILGALVERPGELLTKAELMARVWPSTVVEEDNLKVHVAALRKALGDGQAGRRFIATVPGRGYRFVAAVAQSASPAPGAAAPVKGPHNLPASVLRPIGRVETIEMLRAQVPKARLVTIVGPGGIGKSTVALGTAQGLLDTFPNGTWHIDFAPLGGPHLVASAIASTLQLTIHSEDVTGTLLTHLRDKRMLLVLDGCEHVVDVAAGIAEQIIDQAPGVCILATSREPLRVGAERVHRLRPLSGPPNSPRLTAVEAATYPAVRLFVERAAANREDFELRDEDASAVAELCRRLDGIPLAIELAAARADTFDVGELVALLDDHWALLSRGRRTAPPRHQTLRAAFDWSHDLIPEVEKAVLRRLSAFVAPFSRSDAQAIATGLEIDAETVVEALAQLVSKSLVVADTARTPTRYRLLDTTRAYARTKLGEAQEVATTARRHALHFLGLLPPASRTDARAAPPSADQDAAALLANVRAALDWCFADAGDPALGARLAAGAAELFLAHSQLDECQRWMTRALAVLGEELRDTDAELALRVAQSHALLFMKGQGEPAKAALDRALGLAERLGDRFRQFRILAGLHLYHHRKGEFGRYLATALQAERVAADLHDPGATAAAKVMLGTSRQMTGDLAGARTILSGALHRSPGGGHVSADFYRFEGDAQIILARTLWLLGFPDQALDTVRDVPLGTQPDPVARCLSLFWGATVYHWLGDLNTEKRLVEQLARCADEHLLEPHISVGAGLKGAMLVWHGDARPGIEMLRSALESMRAERYELYTPWLACALCEGLVALGQIDEAQFLMDDLMTLVGRHSEVYYMPELLRFHGELQRKAGDEPAAGRCFSDSLALADKQGTLSWRLRTAMSIARQRAPGPARAEGLAILADTYGRFTEGFETADLVAARRLLDELGPSASDR